MNQGFQQMKHIAKIKSTKLGYDPNKVEEIEVEEYCNFNKRDQLDKITKEYNYLLNMSLWSLTTEKVQELTKQIEVKKVKLAELNATTVTQMWEKDLNNFIQELEKMERKFMKL